jgi:hypothetical protein
MKNSIICTFIIASFLLISQKSNAQQTDYYRTAVGLKFGGYENGPSVKYFATNDVALEGILGIRSHGLVVTGLYEIHMEAFGVRELKFYYGAGAHLGSIGSGTYQRFGGSDQVYTKSQILLGADGVFGLEYFIPRSPIAVSVDLNPRAELATGPFFDIAPGLGVKYAF